MQKQNNKSPLFTIFKRDDIPRWQGYLIRLGSVLISLLISFILASIIIKEPIADLVKTLFNGAFALPWKFALDAALFLGFAIAILPAFKMKFWNMGASGQVAVGALAAIVVMFKLGSWANGYQLRNIILLLLMLAVSIIAAVIWAVIPAIFKAFFGTNETLFTLMTNYIAIALTAYVNFILAKGKKETPGIINLVSKSGWMPTVINEYFLPIVIILIITVIVAIYVGKTKHGYEITVLGDSVNTAKYVGMNVKWITIRTLIVSGLVCGVLGFIYASAINHTAMTSEFGSIGFTGVLIAWLSNFNPVVIGIVSVFLSFLQNGTAKISSAYRLGSNNLSNVIIGLVFFSILIAEFFIRYRVKINIKKNKEEK